MYSAKFVRSDGETIVFDYDHRMIVDIDPLSAIDVSVSTSQGFSQIGESVENRSIGGIQRQLKGIIIGAANDKKKQLLNVFVPFASGKLYFNDKYYCDCVVNKTPDIGAKQRDVIFMITLYCAYPFWLGSSAVSEIINGYTPAFEFPVCYDEHIFGTKNENAFVNVYNSGSVDITYSATFTTDSAVSNYGITNVYTLETLLINDTLSLGETVRVYRDGNLLKVEKTADGVTTDIFSELDEDSDLFYLYPGDNVLKPFGEGDLAPIVTIEYNEAYAGVYDGM